MAEMVRRVDYFYVEVPDQAGEGARLFMRLKEAGVGLLSFTAFPGSGGKTQIDLVPKDPEALLRLAKDAGLRLSARKKALFAEGADRVGVIADLLTNLAGAKINARAGNGSCTHNGGYGAILWVPPDQFEAAAKALGA